MLRLSSNWTLILKIAVPCFYISFFGLMLIAIFIVNTDIWPFSLPVVKFSLLAVYILMILLMYFSVMKLRRIEYKEKHLMVSNYFKTYQYHVKDLKGLKFFNIGLFNIGKFTLKDKGVWGKHLYFLSKNVNVNSFTAKYPELK